MDEHGKYPRCSRMLSNGRCTGTLLPLSDFGDQPGSQLTYKAWGCSNEQCGFGMAIDAGFPGYIETIGKRVKEGPATRRK